MQRSGPAVQDHNTRDDEVRLARVPSPMKEPPATRNNIEPFLSITEPPPEGAKRIDTASHTDSFAQSQPVTVIPKVLVKRASETEHVGNELKTREQQSPAQSVGVTEDSTSESRSDGETRASRRRSTNVFTEPRRPMQHLDEVQQSVKPHNKLDDHAEAFRPAVERPKADGRPASSYNSVRGPVTQRSSTAETEPTVASRRFQRGRDTRSLPGHRL
jgi:hypothetical protein